MTLRTRSARRMLAGAALAAALGLTIPPGAAGIPFGANLSRPANNTFGCETGGIVASPFAPGGLLTTPSGRRTCTWTANGRFPSFAETLTVPRTGVVRRIRVRTGPVTGRMQVVVYSTLARWDRVNRRVDTSQPVACCQVRRRSRVFRPRPNRITTLRVRIPVVGERRPPRGGDVLRVDALALSVLTPGVPVPAHNTGRFQLARGVPVGGIFTPALVRGSRTSPAGMIGFQTLLRADVVPRRR